MKYWLALSLGFYLSIDAANATVVVGDCNQVVEKIEIGDGSTATIVNNCPLKPEDSFTVSFYWLDSLSLSFLMAGYTNDYMKAVLSPDPVVLQNSVHASIKDILKRFGERPVILEIDDDGNEIVNDSGRFDRFPLYSPRIIGNSEVANSPELSLTDMPASTWHKLRIFDGEANIIWPDIDAFEAFFRSPNWPKGYSMTYAQPDDGMYGEVDLALELQRRPTATARYLLECSAIHKAVGKDEFTGYWDRLKKLTKMIKESESGAELYSPFVGADIKWTPPESRSNMNSYEAVKYFGREHWPSDYIFVRGNLQVDLCGGAAGFGLAAIPRDLFTLVAVIKPTSEWLSVRGLVYKEDKQTQLRKDVNPTEEVVQTDELPSITKGQSLVLPLRIELRYDMENFAYMVDDPDPTDIYGKMQAIKDREVVIDPKLYLKDSLASEYVETSGTTEDDETNEAVDLPAIRKSVSAFSAPTRTPVTQTYVYGKSLDLEAVAVKDAIVKVRKTPRYALLSQGGFDGASCPFLYVREADGQLSLKGRILVGADKASKARTEEVAIPAGSLAIVLMEKEPEITLFSSIEYRSGENEPWHQLRSASRLEPGETVELSLPVAAADGAAIRFSGFYRTVDSYLAGATSSMRD